MIFFIIIKQRISSRKTNKLAYGYIKGEKDKVNTNLWMFICLSVQPTKFVPAKKASKCAGRPQILLPKITPLHFNVQDQRDQESY